MDVVLPTPFTPMMKMTDGLSSTMGLSRMRAARISLKISFAFAASVIFSAVTRSRSSSTASVAVVTPTSAITRMSDSSS